MSQPPARLTGRRILITGASSGVGLEAARRFGAEGARLALLARGEEALRAVVAEHGLDALVLPVDLTDRAAVEFAVAAAAEALGGLDVVVSNAASAVFGHVLEVHAEDFDRTVAVTFTGAVNVIRAALPHLRESRGLVVATGSLMARVPLPTWSSYSAAKHALRGFLNSLAIEEREQRTGVRVAIVHPGPIDTPLFAQASSATTFQPRVAPDAYAAGVVAQALVEVAVRPKPEVVLGGETRLLDLMFSVARPAAEVVLLLVDRWYRSGTEPAARPGSHPAARRHSSRRRAAPRMRRDLRCTVRCLGTRRRGVGGVGHAGTVRFRPNVMSDRPLSTPRAAARSRTQQSVRLTGRAAEEVRRSLSEPAKMRMLARKGKQVTEETYRIVVSPEQQKALKEGTQRFAIPGKGNGTVRLRDAAGRPMPEARLEKVDPGAVAATPSPAKLLGPVVWEAMAVATQQHYLVEIDKKLNGIAMGVDEVLAREDDRTLAITLEVRDIVRDSRQRLDAGDALSSARVQELHRLASDARREWHVLHQRARRLLNEYKNGTAERERVHEAWELLWLATDVLVDVSGLLTSLPYATIEDLRAAGHEEHDRVVDAVDNVRALAADMHAAHRQWRSDRLRWEIHGSRNPITNRIRAIRRQPALTKPAQQELDRDLTRQLRELITPVTEPAAMLVTIHADGTVDVLSEPADG